MEITASTRRRALAFVVPDSTGQARPHYCGNNGECPYARPRAGRGMDLEQADAQRGGASGIKMDHLRDEARIPVSDYADIVSARETGRAIAETIGFRDEDLPAIAAAISETARNMVQFAGGGVFVFNRVSHNGREGIEAVAQDNGPGIASLEEAMQDGYSTSGGLGMGLPGARSLVDEFKVVSRLGLGTTVTMRKWLR